MWGLVRGNTSSRRGGLAEIMDAVKRRGEILHHVAEPGLKRRPPSHQYVIVSGG